MLSSSKVIAFAALALLGAASASPLVPRSPAARSNCTPNFQGVDLLVTNRANPAFSLPNSPFHFQFTGQPSNTYNIRPVSLVDKVVAATGTAVFSGLDVVDINFNNADPLQIWGVFCDQCGDPSGSTGPFTTGCHIYLVSNSLCIQLDAAGGNILSLVPCRGGDAQTFDFSTA